MSFNSYNDLQSAIAAWLDKTDLTARIPDFISLCEAKLRREIVHEIGLSSTVALTMNGTSATLPDDFKGAIFLASSDASQPIVSFVSPSDYSTRATSLGYGSPYFYTIVGEQIFVSPSVVTYPTLTLTYRVKIDLLRYGPNWLYENHPDIYLYGSLAEAEPYILEDERLAMWKALYKEAKDSINADGRNLKYGGNLQMLNGGQGYT